MTQAEMAIAMQREWYKHSFADDYLRIYRHRDEAEASCVLRQLLGLIALPAGARCLDLCCGAGRHLAVMLELGLDAVGVDLSLAMLRAAAERPALAPRLVRADMRHLPFTRTFDCVFSFFTSFGYFREDAENQQVMHQIAQILRPGGRVLVDFLNPDEVRQNLIPEDHQEFPNFSVVQRRWIDDANCSVEKDLVIHDKQGQRTYHESVKLYGPDDFRRFFAAVGLQLDHLAGEADGSALRPSSPRQIVIGTKGRA